MSRLVAHLVVVSLLVLWGNREASAQHFGRNKVEYQNFDFKVLETEHFAVYHYSGEEEGARIAARLAERWYARLSRVLGHSLDGRQSLILYGSQPEFAQTNVVDGFLGEGTGGVTESARRRIVMPFAPSLAETDRILGHELTHAFQFDMARRYRGGLAWPLWATEGLAQYLSLGASDAETAMWLRDAVRSDLLPDRQQDAARKFSPYRYGHALWAYFAGRFGDDVIARILKDRDSGASLPRRIKSATSFDIDVLYADWRRAATDRWESTKQVAQESSATPLLASGGTGRLFLGPSLSPNGSQAIFFSERDRVSLDLFLADTATGTITRKLATTAAAARFESLQAIRSAGSWSPDGARFAFAAIQNGQPALVILDINRPGQQRDITLPRFGQILTPSWSPDGGAITFSALEGGITDLFVYELGTGQLRQLTHDAYADLQPVWSPDGQHIAFVTDRFSSDLSALRFGPTELAIADAASGNVRHLPAIEASRHANPQWSADGGSLFFLSEPNGVSNVYRLDLESRAVAQITDVPGGIAGLTPTSPALSAARGAPVLAFTVYRKGRYEIDVRRGAAALEGQRPAERVLTDDTTLPPVNRTTDVVELLLNDSDLGSAAADELRTRSYIPSMFLEALGPPYISAGGGPFGSFVRGGGSVLFSDLLGERKVAVSAQAGNRLRDLALRVRFVNRERRWNWGAVAEVEPSLRRLPRTRMGSVSGEPVRTTETHYFERTAFRVAGLVAYPLNQTQRLEFEAGGRHTMYRQTVRAVGRSIDDGRVLDRSTTEFSGGTPATVGEVSAAYVRDTSVFGPASPILGARSRFEVTSTFGELSATRLLLDHRRYLMPVKPYTVAMRVVHLGQYGPDADDLRLLPAFLGSRQFLRGYGWSSIRCQTTIDQECGALGELLGSRLLVGNIELRAPLMGIRSRELQYGSLPVEAFLFADSGFIWARSPAFAAGSSARRRVSSFGAGARLNAFGFPLELAVVRALDPPSRGWTFDFSFQTGF